MDVEVAIVRNGSRHHIYLTCDVLRKWLLLCRWLHQNILPVEAQSFVCDLSCTDFDWAEALHRIYEQLTIGISRMCGGE